MALERDPGSTANTAYDIGNLSGTENITELLNSTDSTDIYKFSLTETSDFSLTVDGYEGRSGSLGAYLYIDLNQDGQINDDEYLYRDESKNLEINSILDAADYFLRINRRQDNLNTNYNLSLSATPSPSSIDTDPGNTVDTAFNIGNLLGEQTLSEFLGSTDSTDIYKFSLTETSDFSLIVDEYEGRSGSLGAYLYIDLNQDGQINDDEYLYRDESKNLEINSTLGAADYFLRINLRQDNLNTNYNLSLSAPASPPSTDVDPGNSGDTAYEVPYINLNTSEDTRSITEFLGSTDGVDVYKFSLSQTTNVNVFIDNYSGSLGANLFEDSNNNGQIDDGERLEFEEGRNGNRFDFDWGLTQGNYFVSVFPRNDTTNTNYNLDFRFVADPLSVYVSVAAEDAIALEEGTNAAKFRITRDAGSNEAKTINYVIATGNGQAVNGVDYEELSGSVILTAEQGYVDVFVNPIDDDVVEANQLEEVTITLTNTDGDVGISPNKTATVTIEDNDVIPTFTIEAADDEAKEEGEEVGKFRIRHDVNTNKPQTVNYRIATGNNQAVNGEDYRELSGTTTIPEGQDYVELTVKPEEDFLVEGTEKVTITVEDVDGNPGTQDNQTATINLVDNDRHPTFTIEATDNEAGEEGDNTAQFRIIHDGNTAISHTVNYQIATGENQATNGADYEELSGSVTIPEGENSIELLVTPTDDDNLEATERVTITVKDVDGNLGTEDNQTASISIEDNDVPPTFTIEATDNRAAEAETSTGVFKITRDGNTSREQTVNYEIATGSNQATNGVDYDELSGSVTIPEGESSVNLVITPTDDEAVETDERVTITVKDVDGNLGTEDNQTASVMIEDNDIAPPTFSIEAVDNRAAEAETSTGVLRITRDGDTSQAQTVNYEIATGSNQATNSVDYSELSGSITIPEGESSTDLVVTPVDDREIESTERVSITVKDVEGNLGTADNQTASVIIEDNDFAPPTFSIEAVDNRAAEAETSTGVFRITRDGDTTQAQTVNYEIATGNSQATNGVDYSELSGSITIPEGETSVNLVVTPINDEEIEDTEGVTITVEDINGNLGTASNQTASLNIEDNDVEMMNSPIYRFQNSSVPGTYLFAGEQERNAINENFENFDEEGMAFQVATEPGDDLIPIYRFQSLANPGTYLFAGESEREGINENYADSFTEEGMAFYVYGAGTGLGTTFYRFQNSAQPGTYLFAGEAESANIRENFPDFVEEGAAFEVGI